VSIGIKFIDCDIEEIKRNVAEIQDLTPDHFHAQPSYFVA
jgi:hypothetical protein